jgi:hypothetical protein
MAPSTRAAMVVAVDLDPAACRERIETPAIQITLIH